MVLLVPALIIRWLRWLGVVQQKEYRCYRLKHFIITDEGKTELKRLLPQKKDFSRTGLKRPKFTSRIIIIAISSLFLMGLIIWFGWRWHWLIFALGLLLLLAILPLVVIISVLPTTIIFQYWVLHTLAQAQKKIKQQQPIIIGITGSYGKTSTKLICQHLLSQKYKVFATPKSYNTRYSLARSIVQHFQQQELAIIEFAAYKPGEIAYLADKFPPQLAVITGLTDQHLALFGSRQAIIKAKSELVQAVPEGGLVFYNGDDSGALQICQHGGAGNIKDYAASKAENNLNNVAINHRGRLSFTYCDRLIQTKIVGKQYLSALKAAITLGEHFALTQKQIINGLVSFRPPDYFISFNDSRLDFKVLDDGRTSNPVGFQAVINLAQELALARTHYGCKPETMTLITGGIIDLGHRSRAIHSNLAKQADHIFDRVCYTGIDGREQFRSVFANSMLTHQKQIKDHLQKLQYNDLVVIEGRIPLWLRNFLQIVK